LEKEDIFIKTAFVAVVILALATVIFAQIPRYSFEERQRQLDSLEFLQQEAIRSGLQDNFVAEMRQLQAIIKTEIETSRREQRNGQTPTASRTQTAIAANFIENAYNSFMGRPILDKLIIGMGALAVLAAVFLIFTRLFLAILPKGKKAPIKKQVAPTKPKQEKKQAAPPMSSKIVPPPAPQTPPTLETAIYSLRELASKYPSPPAPTNTKVEDLLKIDISAPIKPQEQTNAEIPQPIPQSFEIEMPNASVIPPQTVMPPKQEAIYEAPKPQTPPTMPKIESKPIPTPQQSKPPRALEIRNEIVRRFDANEDIGKIAQDLKMSKDQVAMILRLADRRA